MNRPRRWTVEYHAGTAQSLHSLPAPVTGYRVVRVLSVTEPAIVLGSTQPDDLVDDDRARRGGLSVARRRSGGGAVLLVPDEHVWIDLFVTADDDLWDEDVVAAAGWVGDAWAAAARSLGSTDPIVHRGGAHETRWSRLVCFAGRGPGEVSTGARKLVGVSQRRTRDRLRVQSLVHRRWDAARSVEPFVLADPKRRVAAAELADVVAVVDVDTDVVVAALVDHLPG